MMSKTLLISMSLIAMMTLGVMIAPMQAEDTSAAEGDWFAAVEDITVVKDAPSAKPIPWLTLGVKYCLVSDYIWRGLNFSEYDGEGREKLNHQATLSFEIDMNEIGIPIGGAFGGSIWFEWFAGQERITTWSGRNLQEVDYTLYYSREICDTGLTAELGWIAYTFPPLRDSGPGKNSDGSYTHEVYLTLSYDDSKIFGQAILNPTFTYYLDVDDVRASFMTIGISHDFAIGELAGVPDCPILGNLTATPSATLAIDHRYYDKLGVGATNSKGTRLAYLEYGLAFSLDLSSALGLSTTYGSLTVGTFINYCQSFHDENAAVQDELYGGMTIGWEW